MSEMQLGEMLALAIGAAAGYIVGRFNTDGVSVKSGDWLTVTGQTSAQIEDLLTILRDHRKAEHQAEIERRDIEMEIDRMKWGEAKANLQANFIPAEETPAGKMARIDREVEAQMRAAADAKDWERGSN
jgi:hypothetical protein